MRSTYQSRNASTTTVLGDHPHCLVDRQRFNDMVDVFGLILAKDLQCVDLLEELAIGIGSAGIEGITLINIDDLDGNNGCRLHVLAVM